MKRAILLVVFLAAGMAGGFWWYNHRAPAPRELVLYGNVDLRQVQLAFNNNERIASVLAQEGARVYRGQILARLDTSRLDPQVAEAKAQAEAQRQVVERLHNGTRPEEIAQAKANVASAQADALTARQRVDRLRRLIRTRASSEEDLEVAQGLLEITEARVTVNQKALELALAGPRKEDVAEGEARLRGAEAQLNFLRQKLADATLLAPADAVVRTRLLEPGEMASPQRPVFSLAITDPKWVRAYVAEPDLGKVRQGMTASVKVDTYPGRRFEGWVGFISPVAEFTPKTVQTEELRTSLVYEVRVFVKDPGDELCLGMPATVYLSREETGPPPAPANEDGR